MRTFWKWLILRDRDAPPGYRNVLNRYIFIHILSAVLLSRLIKSDPFNFAGKALFPAASILVGMSLAWTTRASTILQTKELRSLLFQNGRTAEDYIYGFQLAILIIMTMISFVAIMAAGGLDISVFSYKVDRYLSGFWMYLLISLSLRECWGVINFTNLLSLLDYARKPPDNL